MRATSLATDPRWHLTQGWELCESTAGQWQTAAALQAASGVQWLAAPVPGTVAQALQQAGQFNPQHPQPLHAQDYWYLCTLQGQGPHLLRLQGLATVAEVYLDGVLLGHSTSMYQPQQWAVQIDGSAVLHIAFRSLFAHLETLKLPRARWRVAMVPEQALRGVRTTLLGHMPSWCPPIHTVGPWQPVALCPAQAITDVRLRTSADENTQSGVLDVAFACSADLSQARITCAGVHTALLADDDDAGDGKGARRYRAQLHLPQVERWWPQGMGAQTLHAVQLHSPEGSVVALGRVGFRSLRVDRGADGKGFALVVNGVEMFARGAVYTPVDMLHPGSEQGVLERLRLLANMGANLLRVAGPFCYESTAFYEHCAELGLLVWQDLMLANFDYPFADAAFAQSLQAEVQALLARIGHSPALAVLCGGSEVLQQAAMLGLPAARRQVPFFSEQLPALCAQLAPGVVVVENSPCNTNSNSKSFVSRREAAGSADARQGEATTTRMILNWNELSFSVREGVSHYFGVGAYERPLEDARRAAPRFVTECLAFANVPEPISMDALGGVPAVHHPDWKTGVPRDRGASWDFEDTRDHYLERVFGLHPAQLRRSAPAHYLAASRAVVAHVVGQTLAEWRRPASPTRGALVFTAGDLQSGAGWGLIDVQGEPKSPYYAFRQVAQPLALLLSDEGCDGLDIHLVNDTPEARQLVLHVRALRHGSVTVAQGDMQVAVAAHAGITVNATQVLGAFFDLCYAYRFGEPGHDAVVVSAWTQGDASGATQPLLQACHFPPHTQPGSGQGPYAPRAHLGLQAQVLLKDGHWYLQLQTTTLARFVHIDDRTHRPQDNYFHLPPHTVRRVRLLPRPHAQVAVPSGIVTALNALDQVPYRGQA